jgi:hypothetical protein
MLKTLIQVLSGTAVSADAVEDVARTLGISVPSLCDEFAREVAQGFMRGEYSWELGDAAMNGLYGSAYAVGDFGLPDFAIQVYEAFDEGEYRHLNDPSPNGAPRTRTLLEPLLANLQS